MANNIIHLDPDKRNWEYDGDGNKIYKIDVGKPFKTKIEEIPWIEWEEVEPYSVDLDGGRPMPKKKDWIKESDDTTKKM